MRRSVDKTDRLRRSSISISNCDICKEQRETAKKSRGFAVLSRARPLLAQDFRHEFEIGCGYFLEKQRNTAGGIGRGPTQRKKKPGGFASPAF